MKTALLGPPGSGKATRAASLVNTSRIISLACGDILPEDI